MARNQMLELIENAILNVIESEYFEESIADSIEDVENLTDSEKDMLYALRDEYMSRFDSKIREKIKEITLHMRIVNYL